MTSHLESTRGHAKERMNQLKMVLEKMQELQDQLQLYLLEIQISGIKKLSDEVSSVFTVCCCGNSFRFSCVFGVF